MTVIGAAIGATIGTAGLVTITAPGCWTYPYPYPTVPNVGDILQLQNLQASITITTTTTMIQPNIIRIKASNDKPGPITSYKSE